MNKKILKNQTVIPSKRQQAKNKARFAFMALLGGLFLLTVSVIALCQ